VGEESEAGVILRRLLQERVELMRELRTCQSAERNTRAELERYQREEEVLYQDKISYRAAEPELVSVPLARAARNWLRERTHLLEDLRKRCEQLERLLRDQSNQLERLQYRVEGNLRGEEIVKEREHENRVERDRFEEDQEEQSIRDRVAGRTRP